MSTALKRARDWKPAFLERLAQFGNISDAARAANIGRTTVHNHRIKNRAFDLECLEAIDTAGDKYEMEVVKRGAIGDKRTTTVTTVYPDGTKMIKTTEEFVKSDVLLMFHLKALRPEKYRDNYDLAKMVAAFAAANGTADRDQARVVKAPGRKRPA